MQNKFKVGDRVKCMDASNSYLEYGKVYEVSKAFSGAYDGYVNLISEGASGWSTSRFELVKEEVSMHKFKVGDVVKIVGAVDGKHKKFDNTKGFNNNWVNLMDKFIGKVCTVMGIAKNGIDLTECKGYKFPPQALELFTEKMKIQKDKKYQTVEGNYPARVVCTDVTGDRNCIVLVKILGEETVFQLNECGEDSNGCKIIEKVPEIDWSKVEVNTPILVKCLKTSTYVPKHFSHFSSGLVWYFNDGRTSHTSFEGPSLTEPKYATLTNPNEKA